MAPELVRDDPPLVADERASLASWLDFHRTTLRQKCQGLTGQQMVQAAVPPSAMTLLGLVQHMSLVEWGWFEHSFADGPTSEPMETGGDPEAEWHMLDPDRVGEAWEIFERQCAHIRRHRRWRRISRCTLGHNERADPRPALDHGAHD
jgi:hypothetical protein